jgi:hypothetical protein
MQNTKIILFFLGLVSLTQLSIAQNQIYAPTTSITQSSNPATGNVGIGNSSPTFKLDISGNLRTTDFISANQYISVLNGGSYVVALNGQGDGYISGRNLSYQQKFVIASNGASYFDGGNVGINVGVSSVSNKLQIGPNPQGWSGNDLVISNSNTGQISLAISNANDHTMLYGSGDIAIRPGFGKWSVYSKASNAYVGVGHNAPTAMLHVLQSSNSDWATTVLNTGGSGKGLLIKAADGGSGVPLFQIESNSDVNPRFQVMPTGRLQIYNPTAYNFNDVSTNQDHIVIKSNDPGNGGFFGGLTWESGGRRRASIVATREHTDEDYVGIAFLTKGTDGPGPFAESMRITRDGNVGIGTSSPDAKLAVKGSIHTQEVKVDLTGAVAPDYVFEKDYQLLSLSEVEAYICTHKHLPEVPSANQMEQEGLNLKEMNLILLKKIEELTLHLIEQNKIISQQNERITTLEKRKK